MNYRNPNLGRIGSKKFLYIKLCVDIKETLDIKRNALDCFDSQKMILLLEGALTEGIK
jgi:hypothetical protein